MQASVAYLQATVVHRSSQNRSSIANPAMCSPAISALPVRRYFETAAVVC